MTTDELRERLHDPKLVVLDTRPLHAFNGWRVAGAARGGHIPGAVAFPSEWSSLLDDADLGDVLVAKGVTVDREVVLYGNEGDVLADRLARLGYGSVRTHDARAWIADERLPLGHLANYQRLVHVDWLRDVLDGRSPEAAPHDRFLLFHVNFGVPQEYEESHIPGALYLDT